MIYDVNFKLPNKNFKIYVICLYLYILCNPKSNLLLRNKYGDTIIIHIKYNIYKYIYIITYDL